MYDSLSPIAPPLMAISNVSPWLGAVCLGFDYEVNESIPTCATDCQGKVMVNISFMAGLTLREQAGVLAHEALHNILFHGRNDQGKNKNPKIWNIATDYFINGILTEERFSLPFKSLSISEFIKSQKPGKAISQEPVHLYDREFRKYGDEVKLYYYLLKNLPENPQSPQGMGGDDMNENEGDQEAGQYESESSGDSSPKESKIKEILREVGGEGIPKELLTREAGRIACPLVNQEYQKSKSIVDWKSLLKRELSAPCVGNDFVTNKPTRKSVALGPYQRGLGYNPALERRTTGLESDTLVIGVDVSGSCYSFLNQFGSEIESIVKLSRYKEVWIVPCDSEIKEDRIQKLKKGEGFRFNLGTGGGTSFVPLFSFIEHVQRSYFSKKSSKIIYLTDGYGNFPVSVSKKIANNTIWLIVDSGIKAPFGKTINVSLRR